MLHVCMLHLYYQHFGWKVGQKVFEHLIKLHRKSSQIDPKNWQKFGLGWIGWPLGALGGLWGTWWRQKASRDASFSEHHVPPVPCHPPRGGGKTHAVVAPRRLVVAWWWRGGKEREVLNWPPGLPAGNRGTTRGRPEIVLAATSCLYSHTHTRTDRQTDRQNSVLYTVIWLPTVAISTCVYWGYKL